MSECVMIRTLWLQRARVIMDFVEFGMEGAMNVHDGKAELEGILSLPPLCKYLERNMED